MLRVSRCARVAKPVAPFISTRKLSAEADAYDAVIIGGGPVGLALASALENSPIVGGSHSFALIESTDLSKVKSWTLPTQSYSNRVSSITNTSYQFLEKCGSWAHVDATRVNPIQEMQVWDGVSDARIQFRAQDLTIPDAPPQMSRMVENLNLQRAFLNSIADRRGVQLMDNVKVEHIQPDSEELDAWPLLSLSNGRNIRARLLIGADGFNSPVKKYAGIDSYGWTYDTTAVVATLEHSPRLMIDHQTAYQRFLPTGPIAFLPLSSSVSSLVWSTKPALAKALVSSPPETLAHLINVAFRLPDVSMKILHKSLLDQSSTVESIVEDIKWRESSHGIDFTSPLSSLNPQSDGGIPLQDAHLYPPLVTFIQPGTVASFPLRLSHADSYVGEGQFARTVLVGDAAHTIHPLAGQGLNMGLGDVEALVQCIENAVITGSDIGSAASLLPYTSSRYFENHKILSAVDKLHKLYSTTFEPLVWAHSVGLEVINELDTVKTALMMNAGAFTITSPPNPAKVASRVLEDVIGAYDTVDFIAKSLLSRMTK